MKKFRFWLSHLIFEKWLKKPLAQKIGQEIANQVKIWNETHSQTSCEICGQHELREEYFERNLGFFSYPTHFYRCLNCGKTQLTDGSGYKFLSLELKNRRIVQDGENYYRYAFFTDEQIVLLILILIIIFALIISKIFNLIF